MGYGHYFCKKYDENYDGFSSEGQQWIDSVKLCLQNASLPLLNDPSSCIHTTAFDSHPKCYLGNDGEYDSICDLSASDKYQVV